MCYNSLAMSNATPEGAGILNTLVTCFYLFDFSLSITLFDIEIQF